MKIVGQVTRDYYDSCAMYGVDETQVLVRNPEQIVVGKYDRLRWKDDITLNNICYDYNYTYKNDFCHNRGVLFFCGNVYNIYRKYWGREVFVTNAGELVKGFEEKSLFGSRIDTYSIPDNIKNQLEEYAHTLKCPYFLLTIEGKDVVINTWPVLSEIGFQKTVDPFTAYQDIQAYMFGVLGGSEREVVEISDKSKLTKHGFDVKSSFRKQKGEKK